MRFGILGSTQAPVAIGGPRPRALLALLLADTGQVISTDRLLDGLYGENPPKDAANALQAQVSRLRGKLGGELIELHPGGYRLLVDPEDVDAHRFTRLAREGQKALNEPARAAALLSEALELWRGPALSDAPFADAQAARLEELRVTAIEDRAEARLALGQSRDLIAELQELAATHPLRERLRGLLMRALRGAGRQAEALTVFEDTRRTLAEELGTDPSPELAETHLALLKAEPVHTTGIPAQLTSFVGRDEELKRISELLTRARLVTLLGPGGAGKTRLAIEASAREDEACFVDLAPLTDGTEVPQAVLGALGLRENGLFPTPGSQPDPMNRLTAALKDRRLLLVFDNCEHVIADTAAFVHRLLGACPGLRVLATSREPLGITGETLCPLPPLPEESAVRLFTDRAAAVSPGFVLDETVLRICRALDGLPLAIELAAARLRSMSVPQLEARLDDRFRLLSRGSRTAAPRHQTLRAVVAWSWDLLSPSEQRLLRRLAVFTGGATVESAAQVCELSTMDAEDLLTGLADKSLLETTGDRYRMLDTIREFSAERLAEAGEREQLGKAHAEYFLDLARTADPYLRRAEQLTWLARLTAEHANFQAALRWAVHADQHLALALIGALSSYWRLRGVRSEIAPLAAQLVAGLEPPAGLEEEYVLAVLTTESSTVDTYRDRIEKIMRTLDRPLRQPFLMVAWALFSGPPDPDEPLTPLGQQFISNPDPWFQALAHFSTSYLRLFGGDLDGAEPEFDAALASFRLVGDRWGIAQVLDGMATLADLRADPERALALTDEAIDLVSELEAAEELADLWCRRADRLRRAGDAEAAQADYELAVELARRAGVPAILAMAHNGLGELARHRGELAEARRWCELALTECGTDWQSSEVRAQVLTSLKLLSNP